MLKDRNKLQHERLKDVVLKHEGWQTFENHKLQVFDD